MVLVLNAKPPTCVRLLQLVQRLIIFNKCCILLKKRLLHISVIISKKKGIILFKMFPRIISNIQLAHARKASIFGWYRHLPQASHGLYEEIITQCMQIF